jgi:hypothetical protein
VALALKTTLSELFEKQDLLWQISRLKKREEENYILKANNFCKIY